MTLYCFPFAGGSAQSFAGFKKAFHPEMQLHLLELPGRGSRINEPLLDSLEAIATDYLKQMDIPKTPFALWGHSMGAIAAYMVLQLLIRRKDALPAVLFVSGCRGIPLEVKQDAIHSMPSDQFWERIISFGGIPEEIINNADLLQFFEPVIRADIRAVENFALPEYKITDIPIVNLTGHKDEVIEDGIIHRRTALWNVLSTQAGHQVFPGDHFFIYHHVPAIMNTMKQFLSRH